VRYFTSSFLSQFITIAFHSSHLSSQSLEVTISFAQDYFVISSLLRSKHDLLVIWQSYVRLMTLTTLEMKSRTSLTCSELVVSDSNISWMHYRVFRISKVRMKRLLLHEVHIVIDVKIIYYLRNKRMMLQKVQGSLWSSYCELWGVPTISLSVTLLKHWI
jgi:hypothetical protein